MKQSKLYKIIPERWRWRLLHPLFFDQLVFLMLLIEVGCLISVCLQPTSYQLIYPLIGLVLIGITGFVSSLRNRKMPLLLHTSLILSLTLPGIYILIAHLDLRVTIFALPTAYLLQVGNVCHALKRHTYIGYNVLLLVGLLLPMIQAETGISSQAVNIQVILIIMVFCTTVFLVILYLWHVMRSFLPLNEKNLIDKIGGVIDAFSQILIRNDSIDTFLKNVAKHIIPQLEFEDCVIYLIDEERQVLVQKAAFGFKNNQVNQSVIDPIEIPIGQGIVGSVAASGIPEIVHDASKDPRYIVDDALRHAELTVPISINGKIIGIIDSEHHQKNFFNAIHLYLVQIIASLCAAKILEIERRTIYQQSVKLTVEAEKLQEINQTKSRFIANLSHDLKTPLTLVLGPSGELKKKQLSAANKELAELIYTSGNQLRQTIDELLTLNEMAFLAQTSVISQFDFGLQMNLWAKKFEQRANQQEISLTICGEQALQLQSDKNKLTALIFNLFELMLKHAPKGDSVTISYHTGQSDFYWLMSGRLKSTFPVPPNSMIYQLVNDLKGHLFVSAEHEENWQISVQIPQQADFTEQSSHKQEPSKTTPIPSVTKEKQVILFIEDHDDLRQFVEQALAPTYIFLSAENGKKGIEMALKFIPDLIITDLMLPEKSGEEVCSALKNNAHVSHIPIVVLSAKSMVMDRVKLYQLGATNYLPKPFDIKELQTIIANTLVQNEKRRQEFVTDFSSTASTEDAFLNEIIEAIKGQMSDHRFNVSALSQHLKIGRNQLQRKIKTLTDMTPVEFLRFIRLKSAREMLLKTDQTVSEIAYGVGFNNLSYFTRAFKQTFDQLPSDLRTPTHSTHSHAD